MGIPLLAGRRFTSDDTPDKPRVIVVDEFMAGELWPGQDPIGKRIRFGDRESTSPWLTVVGVVGRVKQYSLDADGRIALYLPHTQSGARAMYIVVKGRTDAAALTAGVRRQIQELDADLPIYRLRTMDERVAGSLARRRFSMTLLTLFATIALVLATVGIYGVISYLVTQGTREIGIRIALGATRRAILGLILKQGLALALSGVGIGLVRRVRAHAPHQLTAVRRRRHGSRHVRARRDAPRRRRAPRQLHPRPPRGADRSDGVAPGRITQIGDIVKALGAAYSSGTRVGARRTAPLRFVVTFSFSLGFTPSGST